MGKYGVIDFDEDEIEAAGHWYHDLYLAEHGPHPTAGYPGSMLYAIMDRGALVGVADKINRAKRLASEAQSAARIAAAQAKKATGDGKKELLADVKGLRSIAKKARHFALNEAAKPRAQHATKKKSPAPRRHHASRPTIWEVHSCGRLEGRFENKTEAQDYVRSHSKPGVKLTLRQIEIEDPALAPALTLPRAVVMQHAKKKSPAQLQREIDEVLTGKRAHV